MSKHLVLHFLIDKVVIHCHISHWDQFSGDFLILKDKNSSKLADMKEKSLKWTPRVKPFKVAQVLARRTTTFRGAWRLVNTPNWALVTLTGSQNKLANYFSSFEYVTWTMEMSHMSKIFNFEDFTPLSGNLFLFIFIYNIRHEALARPNIGKQ